MERHFGRVQPGVLEADASALLETSHACVAFTTARDHQIPQAALSVAIQALINAAINRGDVNTGDITSAMGTAFASFAAMQQRSRPATEKMVSELAAAVWRTLPSIFANRGAG